MAYEIVNQFSDGTYHLRDNATGEELPADEGTMQSLSQAGQLSMGGPPKPAAPVPSPQLAPMGPPAAPPREAPSPYPSLGQIGSAIGGAVRGGARALGAPPSVSAPASESPTAPASPAQRIGIKAAPQGPAQRDPNAGLVVQRTGGSPAQWVPTSRSEQGIGAEATNRLQTNADALYQSQVETANKAEELKREELETQRAKAADDRLMHTIRADAKQATINEKQSFIDSTRAKLDERRAKVRDMKVDPDLVWKEKGIAAHILSALAVGAGQFGSMMAGGPNMAAEIINKMIDRSISAQQDNIAKMGAEYSEDNDEFNRSIVGSADADILEQKQLRSEAADAVLAGVLADKDLKYVHVAAQQARDELLAQSIDRQAKIDQMTVRRADERFQPAMAASTRITVNPLLKAQADAAKLQREVDGPATDGSTIIRDAMGNELGRADEKTAKEVNLLARQTTGMTEKLDEMKALLQQGSSLSPSDRARYKALAKSAQIDYKSQAALGVLSEGDMPFLNDQIPPELGLTTNTSQAITAIETTQQNAKRGLNTYYRQQGLTPPTPATTLRSE